MKPIIEVNNLYKKYRIGEKQRYYSFRDTLVDLAKLPFRQKNRLKKTEFWALKDIFFKVMPGEVIGIIGRNGAGKSTLLKILSRITPPTKGEITLRGKVASLLEVGTGFHQELTGRENIFLNGAILGMTQKEITEKFDVIVEFAGIEKFLDTPVKYYSSGMYVRLAFSVAAHMEPDILIVDEVLAVGDAEFQKKCLGKMEEVTQKEGRTILFVSHNIKAIEQLCNKCILLEKGMIKMFGETKKVVVKYLNEMVPPIKNAIKLDKKLDANMSFSKISLTNEVDKITYHLLQSEIFYINLGLSVFKETKNIDISVSIRNSQNIIIFSSLSDIKKGQLKNFLPGKYAFKIKFSGGYLMPDNYFVRISIHHPGTVDIDTREDVLGFTVSATQQGNRALNYGTGCVSFPNEWLLEQ